ncbi:hypothetical protein ACTA71_008002 [Dictyostelium dimigraforme]
MNCSLGICGGKLIPLIYLQVFKSMSTSEDGIISHKDSDGGGGGNTTTNGLIINTPPPSNGLKMKTSSFSTNGEKTGDDDDVDKGEGYNFDQDAEFQSIKMVCKCLIEMTTTIIGKEFKIYLDDSLSCKYFKLIESIVVLQNSNQVIQE